MLKSKFKAITLYLTLLPVLMLLSFNSYAFFWSGWSSGGYTETKHPIVLIHGGVGFDRTDILGVAPTDYWYGIPKELMRDGATVYVLQVSTLHSPEVRGEQAIREMETIKAITGDEKFNLIGHSFGAPTARYVAGVRSNLVASVSTVGGSNDTDQRDLTNPPTNYECDTACKLISFGGDVLIGLAGVSFTETKCTTDVYSWNRKLRTAAKISCEANNKEYENSGLPVDVAASLDFIERTEAFNRDFNQGRPNEFCGEGATVGSDGIHYYSWSGTQPFTNPLDPSDLVMVVAGGVGDEDETDGLVGRCNSHWGEVIRDDYPMNHIDETNLLWGLVNPFFDPVKVYRTQANRLKAQGL